MNETLRAHRDASLGEIAELIRRGRRVVQTADLEAVRSWQRDCAAAINALSGGSKAHWLARAYSDAFLPPSDRGSVVVEASLADIIGRILHVLARAHESLSRVESDAAQAPEAPVRRFAFVHDVRLRPLLEQTYIDSARALETGDFREAFQASCGMLEAIITDALEHDRSRLHEAPPGEICDWSFGARIAAAEAAGLIRRACDRLPPSARAHRESCAAAISAREAKLVRQVLHVVMRDLDPGR